MSDETWPTIRQAARSRRPLGGPDAQALEGALQQVERDLDDARRRLAAAEGLLRRWLTVWEAGEFRALGLPAVPADTRAFLGASTPTAEPLAPDGSPWNAYLPVASRPTALDAACACGHPMESHQTPGTECVWVIGEDDNGDIFCACPRFTRKAEGVKESDAGTLRACETCEGKKRVPAIVVDWDGFHADGYKPCPTCTGGR